MMIIAARAEKTIVLPSIGEDAAISCVESEVTVLVAVSRRSEFCVE